MVAQVRRPDRKVPRRTEIPGLRIDPTAWPKNTLECVKFAVDWRPRAGQKIEPSLALRRYFERAGASAPDATAKILAKRLQYLYWSPSRTVAAVAKRESPGCKFSPRLGLIRVVTAYPASSPFR